DIDRLDVRRVDVGRAVRGDGALVAAHRRLGRVVDRLTVDDEQRLVRAGKRGCTADLDGRGGTWFTRLCTNLDVRRLCRQCRHDVLWLRHAVKRCAVDGIDRRCKTLARGRGPGTGHDDLAKPQRIRDERKVLGETLTVGQSYLNGLGRESDHACR